MVLPSSTRPVPSVRLRLSLAVAGSAFTFFLLLLIGPTASAQSGAVTATAALDELVDQAATVVRGSVVSAAIEPHPQLSNLQTVVVTVSVAKVLKGESAKILTFRQFVWDPHDAADAAGYRKGGELLLFLNPVSTYGLTSPVGLDQGRFRIFRDAKGKAFAVNGRANVALFDHVLSKASSRGINFSRQAAAAMTAPPGPQGRVPLESLEDAIAILAKAGR